MLSSRTGSWLATLQFQEAVTSAGLALTVVAAALVGWGVYCASSLARLSLEVLGDLAALRVVDLTHPLHAAMPYWPGEGYAPFRYTQINTFERDHKAAGVFEMPEHMGTHLDAPNHFVAGGASVDRLGLEVLLRPATLFDIAQRAASKPAALLEEADVRDWESQFGRVPEGSVALVRSGWAARWSTPAAFLGKDADGVMRFPAVSPAAARLLVQERGVAGIGIDTLSVDNGEVDGSPCHHLVHAAAGFILENLANLEQLPERGAFLLIAPLPIVDGTGAPARILAFCNGE